MALVVYSGSDRALRARKIKHGDSAVSVADEGTVGTGTNYLSDVVNGRDDGAVIVGLVAGTADLYEFVVLVDKESIAGEIVADYLAPLLISVNRTMSSRASPKNSNRSGMSRVVNL